MRCDECGLELDAAKVLRCTKCKACVYCSRKCQTRNWKRIHKRVCTTDPKLRPFVRVEQAIERSLGKLPKIMVPRGATCYICLEEEGEPLMRGCACRGDSAGFVHLKCLSELASSSAEFLYSATNFLFSDRLCRAFEADHSCRDKKILRNFLDFLHFLLIFFDFLVFGFSNFLFFIKFLFKIINLTYFYLLNYLFT